MKKIISSLLTLCLVVSMFAGFVAPASAVSYNASKAIAWAQANWNKPTGQCAEFVSRCLTAGGINVLYTGTGGLTNALFNKGYATKYKITKFDSSNRIKFSDHSGKISVGDVLGTYCTVCKQYTHVMLINNSGGYVSYYAWNSSANNKTYYAGYYYCNNNRSHSPIETHVLHINTTGTTTQQTTTQSQPATITLSKSSLSLDLSSKPSDTVNITVGGTLPSTYYLSYKCTSSISASWGSWSNKTNSLKITANSQTANGSTVTIYLYDKNTGKSVASKSLTLNVKQKVTPPGIQLASFPASINQGSSYSLKGTIYTNGGSTEVRGYILDANGKTVQSSTAQTTSSSSFNINTSNVNYQLLFNKLSAGTYTLKITAKNSAGTSTFTKSFTVNKKVTAPTVNVTSYPTSITQGSSYSLKGTVNANGGSTEVRGYIIDANGKTVQASTAQTTSSSSFNINTSNVNYQLLFNKLSAGTYTLKIIAKNSAGTSTFSKAFTVKAKQPATITLSKSSMDLNLSSKPSDTVNVTVSGDLPSNYYLSCNRPSSVNGSWGGWTTTASGKQNSLKITATDKTVTNGTVTISLIDRATGKSVASKSFTLNVTKPQPATITLSKSSMDLNLSSKPSDTVNVTVSGDLPSNYYLSCNRPSSVTGSWGGWTTTSSGKQNSLKITATDKTVTNGTVTISLIDRATGKSVASKSFKLNVTKAQSTNMSLSKYTLDLDLSSKRTDTIIIGLTGPLPAKYGLYYSSNSNATLKWGGWADNEKRLNSLKVTATDKTVNGSTITISLKDNSTGKVIATKTVKLNVSNAPLPNGTYVITTKLNSGYALDIKSSSKANGANVQLWKAYNTTAQKFKVTHLGNGYYQIVNVNSNKALDAQNGDTTAGTNVWQYEINNTPAQTWKLVDAGNGYYYIVCKKSGLYLDLNNANVASGENIKLWNLNGNDAQKWKFTKVSQ